MEASALGGHGYCLTLSLDSFTGTLDTRNEERTS
jgi:hypothetical protein